MTRIAFHTNQLSLRGTEVAMYDYAHYNEKILGNESIVLTRNPEVWKYSDVEAIKKFEKRFKIFYYKEVTDIEKILDDNQIDIFYALKSGHRDGVISNKRKTVIHAVFQDYDPHGNVYAFVSEWLARRFHNAHQFVPHMVDLPDHNKDMREELGIPKDAFVFGRHGGYETFDIPWVKDILVEIVKHRKDVYFLFLNTEKFVEHPQVMYLEPTADVFRKTEFINTCTAMLHARLKGETFGLAIGEFSVRNKPIISFGRSQDMNHELILGTDTFFYNSPIELKMIFTKINDYFSSENLNRDWNKYREFSPEKVMEKFKKVFIDD